MPDFALAGSLVRQRSETNTTWPDRDRTSDGWIGDASHQARPSDHNPDWSVKPPPAPVRATDTDRDGIDPMALVAAAIGHPSTNYVIFDGSIWSRAYGFRRRVYTGSNRHEHHVHISILHSRAAENSTAPWLRPVPVATPTDPLEDLMAGFDDRTIPSPIPEDAGKLVSPRELLLSAAADARYAREQLDGRRAGSFAADVRAQLNEKTGALFLALRGLVSR